MSENHSNRMPLLHPGQVFERYTVERLLGHGGMGEVWLAHHNTLDVHHALKLLFPELADANSTNVERFLREAQLAGRIKHPNLIEVHDAGCCEMPGEDGQPRRVYYIFMDYLSGGSLADRLRQCGRMAPMPTLEILRQVTSALIAAEANQMVHRDIKPDNIMFTDKGLVKLADLGIAKSTSSSDQKLTNAAVIFGTPAYMSPQQAQDARQVDIRADIYSLGCVAFEMLTGRPPYLGRDTMEILAQVVSPYEIPKVRDYVPKAPRKVARLVADMCMKRLEKRIQNPRELMTRIDALIAEESIPEEERRGWLLEKILKLKRKKQERESPSPDMPASAVSQTPDTVHYPKGEASSVPPAQGTLNTIHSPKEEEILAMSSVQGTLNTIHYPKEEEILAMSSVQGTLNTIHYPKGTAASLEKTAEGEVISPSFAKTAPAINQGQKLEERRSATESSVFSNKPTMVPSVMPSLKGGGIASVTEKRDDATKENALSLPSRDSENSRKTVIPPFGAISSMRDRRQDKIKTVLPPSNGHPDSMEKKPSGLLENAQMSLAKSLNPIHGKSGKDAMVAASAVPSDSAKPPQAKVFFMTMARIVTRILEGVLAVFLIVFIVLFAGRKALHRFGQRFFQEEEYLSMPIHAENPSATEDDSSAVAFSENPSMDVEEAIHENSGVNQKDEPRTETGAEEKSGSTSPENAIVKALQSGESVYLRGKQQKQTASGKLKERLTEAQGCIVQAKEAIEGVMKAANTEKLEGLQQEISTNCRRVGQLVQECSTEEETVPDYQKLVNLNDYASQLGEGAATLCEMMAALLEFRQLTGDMSAEAAEKRIKLREQIRDLSKLYDEESSLKFRTMAKSIVNEADRNR